MRAGIKAAWASVAIAITMPANSATIDFSFTGDPANISIFNGTNGAGNYTLARLSLEDATTNSALVPAFSASIGDVIQGTVLLSSPFVVPKGAYVNNAPSFGGLGITLLVTDDPGDGGTISYTQTFDIYNGATLVDPLYSFFPATTGALALGGFSLVDTPAFSFDRIVFAATITGSSSFANPINFAAGSAYLRVITYPAGPVPEPATWTIMVSGFGLIGGAMRRKRDFIAVA